MTQTAIPTAFENYLQTKVSAGETPDMNQIVFAYIPDLDLESEIDREEGLVDEAFWVYQQDVDQVGKLNDNALVYSVIVPSTIQAFTFNAIYLHDKNAENSCGMVIHKAEETKEAGMVTTRSLVQQYNGAAYLTNITVTAETWQIDYQARMLGIDEEQRLSSLVAYGHTAFIEGFNISQNADPTKFTIEPGIAYIGGLRAEITEESIQTVSSEIDIYLDVSRNGSANSMWENDVSLVQSSSTLSDYTDNSGVKHYVGKLASIDSEGNVFNLQVDDLGVFERRDKPTVNIIQSKFYKSIDGPEGIQRDTLCDEGISTREIWITLTAKDRPYGSTYEDAIQFEGASQIVIQATTTNNLTEAKGYQSGDYARLGFFNVVDNGYRDVTAHFYICAVYEAI